MDYQERSYELEYECKKCITKIKSWYTSKKCLSAYQETYNTNYDLLYKFVIFEPELYFMHFNYDKNETSIGQYLHVEDPRRNFTVNSCNGDQLIYNEYLTLNELIDINDPNLYNMMKTCLTFH